MLATHPDKLVVLVPRFGIEGTIWLNDASKLNGDEVSFDADAHQVMMCGVCGGWVGGLLSVCFCTWL